MTVENLFSKETIYHFNVPDIESAFKLVSEDLTKKGLVKEGFLESVLNREKNYPTGLDMSPVNPEFPNIAVPHTESEYVNCCRIVPIRLEQAIVFHNMIKPSETLKVSYLFMILNNDGAVQSNILAQIMDFINSLSLEEAKSFFKEEDTDLIYNFLIQKFEKKGESND